jgi:hypothetical protein
VISYKYPFPGVQWPKGLMTIQRVRVPGIDLVSPHPWGRPWWLSCTSESQGLHVRLRHHSILPIGAIHNIYSVSKYHYLNITDIINHIIHQIPQYPNHNAYSHSISDDTTVPTMLFILCTSYHSPTLHDSVPITHQIPQYPHHNATSIIYQIS